MEEVEIRSCRKMHKQGKLFREFRYDLTTMVGFRPFLKYLTFNLDNFMRNINDSISTTIRGYDLFNFTKTFIEFKKDEFY